MSIQVQPGLKYLITFIIHVDTDNPDDGSDDIGMWFNCLVIPSYDVVEPSWPMETDQLNPQASIATEKDHSFQFVSLQVIE